MDYTPRFESYECDDGVSRGYFYYGNGEFSRYPFRILSVRAARSLLFVLFDFKLMSELNSKRENLMVQVLATGLPEKTDGDIEVLTKDVKRVFAGAKILDNFIVKIKYLAEM